MTRMIDTDKLLKSINKGLDLSATNGARCDSICMNRHTIEALRKLATYPIGENVPRPRYATVCGLNIYVNNVMQDGDFIMYAQNKVHPVELFNGEGLYKDQEDDDEE